jgi:acetyl esterase/lipase
MDQDSVPAKYREYFLSREQNAHAPVLDAAGIAGGALATQEDPTSEFRYPVLSDTAVSDQPSTYIQVCGMDPYRDDSLIYHELLKDAGVATKVDFYPGSPHGFWLAVPGSDVANKALVDIVVGFGWLLGKQVGRGEAAKALKLEA